MLYQKILLFLNMFFCFNWNYQIFSTKCQDMLKREDVEILEIGLRKGTYRVRTPAKKL